MLLTSVALAIGLAASQQANLVKNPNFTDRTNMNHWSEYKQDPRINGFHVHDVNGLRTAHLHGYCYQTAGGMSQEISFEKGRYYELKFVAFDFDGRDGETLKVGIDGILDERDFNVPGENTFRSGQGKAFAVTFQATESVGLLHFWTGREECVDIESVSIIQGESTTATTTTTTTTTTTLLTSTTESTTTNTIAAAMAKLPTLGDIEKLIETQIKLLQADGTKLAARVDALSKDNAALQGKVQTLSTENEKLNGKVADLQSQLVVTSTQSPVTAKPAPFTFRCEDSGATECAPNINAIGNDVAVQACCGKIELHSTECSVNPCELLAAVEDLQRRL